MVSSLNISLIIVLCFIAAATNCAKVFPQKKMISQQSNTRSSHLSKLAHDRNLNTFSVAENDDNGDTWWETDLGSMHTVASVKVITPTDEKYHKFSDDFDVWGCQSSALHSDLRNCNLCASCFRLDPYPGRIISLDCKDIIQARYIVLKKHSYALSQLLVMAEIEILIMSQ